MRLFFKINTWIHYASMDVEISPNKIWFDYQILNCSYFKNPLDVLQTTSNIFYIILIPIRPLTNYNSFFIWIISIKPLIFNLWILNIYEYHFSWACSTRIPSTYLVAPTRFMQNNIGGHGLLWKNRKDYNRI